MKDLPLGLLYKENTDDKKNASLVSSTIVAFYLSLGCGEHSFSSVLVDRLSMSSTSSTSDIDSTSDKRARAEGLNRLKESSTSSPLRCLENARNASAGGLANLIRGSCDGLVAAWSRFLAE